MEIKFGTDTFEKPQRDAYTEIAGDRTKVKVLDPDECGCNSDDDGKKSTVTEWATAAVATLVALAQLRKGKILKCQNSHPLHFNLEKEMHFKTERRLQGMGCDTRKRRNWWRFTHPSRWRRLCWSYSSHSCGFIF